MSSGTWEGNPMGYTTVEMLLDDVSKQMASSNLTRYSRGSQGQRTGGSMRIVKPNSASNSPRGSMGLGRRRTVMNDGAYRRRLAMLEQQNAMAAGGFISNDGLQIPTQSARPMSWHPASHLAPQPAYHHSYPIQTPEYNQHLQAYDMPPTPAVYSSYASPDSTFSPLSMPFTGHEQPQSSYQISSSAFQSQPQYLANQQPFVTQQTQHIVSQTTANTDPTMYSHFDWNNFATNGFESSSTAPPTPENFLPIQYPEPAFSAEESIPYQPLEDSESGGEELIGMGLYDNPDPVKTSSSLDPQLDNYRALMMSHLMGHRKTESTGKGLKLEETWEPPASDDEDDEQDGEGEDEELEEVQPVVAQTQVPMAPHPFARDGWL